MSRFTAAVLLGALAWACGIALATLALAGHGRSVTAPTERESVRHRAELAERAETHGLAVRGAAPGDRSHPTR